MSKVFRRFSKIFSKDNSKNVRLYRLQELDEIDGLGQKAMHSRWLLRHTENVPESYVLTSEICNRYFQEPEKFSAVIAEAVEAVLDPAKTYVVRSSSMIEDQAKTSFAGQFTSHTNVQGFSQVAHAIRDVIESANAENVRKYQDHFEQSGQAVGMAVLIQEMIPPLVSGVSVSRNPLTGLNEIMVEAVEGSGEALVQDGITPNHWVHKWGRFIHQPGDPILPIEQVEGIVNETRNLGDAFGSPVDLEWVFDGVNVYWVQIRPLTGLEDINVYSNTISKEQLPGLIKPLVWSVNIPLVNSAWIQIFEDLVGSTGLKPEQLAKSFYYRAYFNMGVVGHIFEILGFPRDSLELLMGFEKSPGMPAYRPTFKTLRFLPRVIGFMLSLPLYPRRLEKDFVELKEAYSTFKDMDLRNLSEEQILHTYDWLFDKNLKVARHNILVPLIMGVYNGMLSKMLRMRGVDPLEFDSTEGMEELEALDPNHHIEFLHEIYEDLSPQEQELLRKSLSAGDRIPLRFKEFHSHFEIFIRSFGHFGESGNDFSSTPWREKPEQVLEMISKFTPKQSKEKIGWKDLRINPIALVTVRSLGWRTRKYILARERVSSLYTLGYGFFRDIFMVLGRKFVDREVLQESEDIFYLSLDEVCNIVSRTDAEPTPQDLVDQRKAEMEFSRKIILPDTFYGDEVPPLEAFADEVSEFHGMPTSRGYYCGKVTVIQSLDQSDKLEDGDVLVVPYSDVAWTPLFGRAGAVIAQSGGVLSHSSIVAREMGIPCVVSVANACQLPDGTVVVVDGHRGEIMIKEAAQ